MRGIIAIKKAEIIGNEMFVFESIILVLLCSWSYSDFAVSIQTGEIQKKPLIFLNFNNFWAPFGEMLFNMLQEGTLNKDKTDFIEFVNEPSELFDAIEKVQNRLDAAVNKKSKKK